MDAVSGWNGMKNKQHGKVGNCVSVCLLLLLSERNENRERNAASAAAAENKAITRGAQ